MMGKNQIRANDTQNLRKERESSLNKGKELQQAGCKHQLLHVADNNLQWAVPWSVWLCKLCLTSGQPKHMAITSCNPAWCTKRAQWWSRRSNKAKCAIVKAIGYQDERVAEQVKALDTKADGFLKKKKSRIRSQHEIEKDKEYRAKLAKKRRQDWKDSGLPDDMKKVLSITRWTKNFYWKGLVKKDAPAAWKRDLTREGVEPHPGPRPTCNPMPKIWQINIRSFTKRGQFLLDEAMNAQVDAYLCKKPCWT